MVVTLGQQCNVGEKPTVILQKLGVLRPTLMHTKNLYENGSNPVFVFGTKNMSEGHLMHTVLVCYFFDKLGQACLCG